MDIVEINVTKAKQVNFMDLAHPDQKDKCQRYVEKCEGPTYVYKEQGEKTPIEYLVETFKPLQKYKDKIALVIDSSTTRGFCEPSQAAMYAQQLGLRHAQCFDISEACNGFSRSLKTAYQYFETEPSFKDKYVLIINNEQPPENRALVPQDKNDFKAAASYYVGLTFSHVCCCTIVKKSDNYSWEFMNDSDTIYASHICIPLPGLGQGFLPECEHYSVELNDKYGQFCIPKLHQIEDKAVSVLGYVEKRMDFYKDANVICHTFTKLMWKQLFQFTGVGKLSLAYNETGNLGSASLPFVIFEQYGNKIPEGEKLAFMGVGAGGSGVVLNWQQGSHQEKQEQTAGRLGKYGLMAKIGFRVATDKLMCKKRKNKVVDGQKTIKIQKKES